MRLRTLLARLMRHDEGGVVLPLIAASMVAVSGFVALSVDIGRLAQTRRQLQNAADASVLAGASQLPGDPDQAKADALTWATRNGLSATEVISIDVSKTNFDNDTLLVTTRRNVPYTFARVLGFVNKDVTATAKVLLQVTQGADTQGNGFFPYAVWGGNTTTPQYPSFNPPTYVIYRSGNYGGVNVKTIPSDVGKAVCEQKFPGGITVYNCNWSINSNTFKGYFHWKNRYVWIDATNTQTFNQGGTSFGTQSEPVAQLVGLQQSGTPVWLPYVFTASDQSSSLEFMVVDFVCVQLDVIDQQGSADWGGWIQDPSSPGCAKGVGLPTGGQNPPPGLPPVYNYRLVQ